jgi:hypothetical protein
MAGGWGGSAFGAPGGPQPAAGAAAQALLGGLSKPAKSPLEDEMERRRKRMLQGTDTTGTGASASALMGIAGGQFY